MAERHPRSLLDDHFASPIRFSLMAALQDGGELDFGTVATVLDVGDSALSKAISHLAEAHYVATRRGQLEGRKRLWVRATPAGKRAFTAHLAALAAIVAYGSGDVAP